MKNLTKICSIHFISVICVICGLICSSDISFSQDKTDSILQVLELMEEDTNKVNLLRSLSRELTSRDTEKALAFANRSLELAKKLNFKTAIARNYNHIGVIYNNQGNYSKALGFYLKAVKIHEELGYKQEMAEAYNNIGVMHFHLRNYPRAIEWYLKALNIYEVLGNRPRMAKIYNNIGIIYKEQQDYSRALEYYLNSLQIKEQLENKQGMAASYNNIGEIYQKQKSYNEALVYYNNALRIYEELNAKQFISIVLINIGEIYSKQGSYEKAIEYVKKSLKISKDLGLKVSIKYAYKALSEDYASQNQFKEAYRYHQLLSEVKDILINESKNKQIAEMSAKYKSAQKDKEIFKLEATQVEERAEKTILSIVLVAVILLMGFIIYGYIQKRKANKIIAQKSREVTDSIAYAQKIQEAILPEMKQLKQALPDSFVLYKPKSIVSGDFYWYVEKQGYKFIAAVDCTGHGVPGAILSVVGHTGLSRAVNEFNLSSPGAILDKLNDYVKETFRDVKDGMDIALCSIDMKNNKLEYAGANNSLYLLRKKNNPLTPFFKDKKMMPAIEGQEYDLYEIKADRYSIGPFEEKQSFTSHSLNFKKNDSIYIFSDGYADQFGGPKGKKFKYKQFIFSFFKVIDTARIHFFFGNKKIKCQKF